MWNIIKDFHKLQDKTRNNKSFLESIAGSDRLIRFFTGLNTYTLFLTIFNFVASGVSQNMLCSLSQQEQFLLTLMRLRLNLRELDLAHRFGISQSTVSRYFQKWVTAMYVRLVPVLLKWPDREYVFQTMPMSFREKFPNCIVIIDCFEVFMDRHCNIKDRASTYSSYKGHNTAKYLIGITPQGTISFISMGYCGRSCDKFIVETSGFLDHLLPGDLVLADRGFNVPEAVGLMGAKIETPAFKEHRPQLSPLEVKESREIANVRIHVERVIGCLKSKYSILTGNVIVPYASPNADNLCFFDKIVSVCCCLINCNPVIVPKD